MLSFTRITGHLVNFNKSQRRIKMRALKLLGCAAFGVALATAALAQSATNSTFEKKNFNYGEWTKGKFSEVVTVVGPGKMIFLAGVGSEEENDGSILHKGDVLEQCRYAYQKIKKVLARHDATIAHVVKIVTYVTDARYVGEVTKCKAEAFGNAALPAHTFVNVSQLAWPGMLVEVDAIAIAPSK
jgi:2-iminobutanoate/2-iminopropanoate deaminase